MIKDHQESLAVFQRAADEERAALLTKHTTEIEEYKAQIVQITADLAKKISVVEAEMQSLIEKHAEHVASLIEEKNSEIANLEARNLEREKELEREISDLKDAFARTQSKMIVINFLKPF